MVGASAHRVALDNVEVLEVDQWLALLIIGDLAPYTQPVTGPELLPTRSAKSQISTRVEGTKHVQVGWDDEWLGGGYFHATSKSPVTVKAGKTKTAPVITVTTK